MCCWSSGGEDFTGKPLCMEFCEASGYRELAESGKMRSRLSALINSVDDLNQLT